MVTDATRKYRDVIAFALLTVGALYFVGSLGLLFTSGNGSGFGTRSAVVVAYFEAPVPVISLVVAVLLVTRLGEPSANARAVVLAVLGIVGLDLLFAVVTFLAQFASRSDSGYSGVDSAGKVVGLLLGLAQLVFLAAAGFFAGTALHSLPDPVQPGYQPPTDPPAGTQGWWQPPS